MIKTEQLPSCWSGSFSPPLLRWSCRCWLGSWLVSSAHTRRKWRPRAHPFFRFHFPFQMQFCVSGEGGRAKASWICLVQEEKGNYKVQMKEPLSLAWQQARAKRSSSRLAVLQRVLQRVSGDCEAERSSGGWRLAMIGSQACQGSPSLANSVWPGLAGTCRAFQGWAIVHGSVTRSYSCLCTPATCRKCVPIWRSSNSNLPGLLLSLSQNLTIHSGVRQGIGWDGMEPGRGTLELGVKGLSHLQDTFIQVLDTQTGVGNASQPHPAKQEIDKTLHRKRKKKRKEQSRVQGTSTMYHVLPYPCHYVSPD